MRVILRCEHGTREVEGTLTDVSPDEAAAFTRMLMPRCPYCEALWAPRVQGPDINTTIKSALGGVAAR